MPDNLYDPAAMLEAERLTLESLPDSALFHRAWCDPNECYLTPAGTPLNAPAAAKSPLALFRRSRINGTRRYVQPFQRVHAAR